MTYSFKITMEQRETYGKNGINVVWGWAVNELGWPNETAGRWWWDTRQTFYFRNNADRTLFALMWL